MKAILIATAIGILIFVLFQSFTYRSIIKTEKQKYIVIQKDKDFEVRFYPSAVMATINSSAKSYKELANPGFRKLAGYIFGGNEGDTRISMTSPVHMEINDSISTMSFVMPSTYTESTLPRPNDPNVILHNSSEEYVAVIRFGGFASDRRLKVYSEKLQKLLTEKGISSFGHYRYLGYNPPFQLFGRRNEVIVSVKWN
jgi:hypothetical protein